jgi:hypothetical protein
MAGEEGIVETKERLFKLTSGDFLLLSDAVGISYLTFILIKGNVLIHRVTVERKERVNLSIYFPEEASAKLYRDIIARLVNTVKNKQ